MDIVNIRANIKEIIKSKDESDFLNLVNHLKHANCKTEAEIRGIFAANGMPPNLFDELMRKSISKKNP